MFINSSTQFSSGRNTGKCVTGEKTSFVVFVFSVLMFSVLFFASLKVHLNNRQSSTTTLGKKYLNGAKTPDLSSVQTRYKHCGALVTTEQKTTVTFDAAVVHRANHLRYLGIIFDG